MEPAMADEDRERLVDDYFYLWVLIAQTRDALTRARERDHARYEVTNERRAVLYIIDRNGGAATPVEIARDLFRELHSVTGLLKRMEDAGLVSRHKGSGRSKVEVRLTDKGREVLEASSLLETDERIFSVLTKRERERLAHYLLKVRGRALEDLGIRDWELHLPNSSLTPKG
jgi:DNA-binding MarR family transcriptional regulator